MRHHGMPALSDAALLKSSLFSNRYLFVSEYFNRAEPAY